mmetsp:Transcript_31013/g.87866  ORF Transcript_31013/g.87866 Transcript_31013/m.87866 type:complete len:659 (-) Transcript_31013:253-2229(-)
MLSRDGLRSCEGLYEELQALVAAARINPRVASHGDELCSIEELLLWRNQDSRTVLHLACELGLYNAAAYIIRQGVPGIVNLADDVRTTPLHVAARLGHANIVELLLREGADARAMERSGITAMHHAASAGSVESILLLKHNGGDIDAYSGAGTPLHWAAGEGQSAALQQLIDLGASMNTLDCDGMSPLAMAAMASMEDAACLLLDAGIKIGTSRLPFGMNLLHLAAEMGMERLSKKLINSPQGRSLALQTADGRLPVHVAAAHGCDAIAEMLLPYSQLAHGTSVEELIEDASMDFSDEWAAYTNGDGMSSLSGTFHDSDSLHFSDGSTPNLHTPTTGRHSSLGGGSRSSGCGGGCEATTPLQLTPITPALPQVQRPNEPTQAASTPEALSSAVQCASRGDDLLAENDMEGALRAYTEAIKFNGADADLWGKRAKVHLMIAEINGALPQPHLSAATPITTAATDSMPLASCELRGAASAVSRFPPSDTNKSSVLKAYGDATVATEIDPQSPFARKVLGKALLMLGWTNDAEAQFACMQEDVATPMARPVLEGSPACEPEGHVHWPQTQVASTTSFGPGHSPGLTIRTPKRQVSAKSLRQQEGSFSKVNHSPIRTALKKTTPMKKLAINSPSPAAGQEPDQVCSPLTKFRASVRPLRLRK